MVLGLGFWVLESGIFERERAVTVRAWEDWLPCASAMALLAEKALLGSEAFCSRRGLLLNPKPKTLNPKP